MPACSLAGTDHSPARISFLFLSFALLTLAPLHAATPPFQETGSANANVEASRGGFVIAGSSYTSCSTAGCATASQSSFDLSTRLSGSASAGGGPLQVSVQGTFIVASGPLPGVSLGGNSNGGSSQTIYVNLPQGTPVQIHVIGNATLNTDGTSQTAGFAKIITDAGAWSGAVDQTYSLPVGAASINVGGIDYHRLDHLGASGQAAGDTGDTNAHTVSFSVNATWQVVPGSIGKSIQIISGSGQSNFIASPLTKPLVILVTDAFTGSPVPQVPVNWAITAPVGANGQSVSPTSGPTDVNGNANTSAALGNLLGQYDITAACSGCSGSPATFPEYAVPSNPNTPNTAPPPVTAIPGASGNPTPGSSSGGGNGGPTNGTTASAMFSPGNFQIEYAGVNVPGGIADTCVTVSPASEVGNITFVATAGLAWWTDANVTGCTGANQIGLHVTSDMSACSAQGTVAALLKGTNQSVGDITGSIILPGAIYSTFSPPPNRGPSDSPPFSVSCPGFICNYDEYEITVLGSANLNGVKVAESVFNHQRITSPTGALLPFCSADGTLPPTPTRPFIYNSLFAFTDHLGWKESKDLPIFRNCGERVSQRIQFGACSCAQNSHYKYLTGRLDQTGKLITTRSDIGYANRTLCQ